MNLDYVIAVVAVDRLSRLGSSLISRLSSPAFFSSFLPYLLSAAAAAAALSSSSSTASSRPLARFFVFFFTLSRRPARLTSLVFCCPLACSRGCSTPPSSNSHRRLPSTHFVFLALPPVYIVLKTSCKANTTIDSSEVSSTTYITIDRQARLLHQHTVHAFALAPQLAVRSISLCKSKISHSISLTRKHGNST